MTFFCTEIIPWNDFECGLKNISQALNVSLALFTSATFRALHVYVWNALYVMCLCILKNDIFYRLQSSIWVMSSYCQHFKSLNFSTLQFQFFFSMFILYFLQHLIAFVPIFVCMQCTVISTCICNGRFIPK